MTQIKIFKHEDLNRLENEVNRWLQEHGDKIQVISVDNKPHQMTGTNLKPTNVTTVLYEERPSVLHD